MQKDWTVKRDCRGMETGEIIDAILEDRGIENVAEFLNPPEDNILPFEDFKNIKEAANVINYAIDNHMKFLVYYDVDLDGCASGSIATQWLQMRGIDVITCINNGKEHGINNIDIKLLKQVDILWIVDSIETRMYPYEKVLKSGIKHVIITDHHLISRSLEKDLDLTGKITLVSSAVDYPNSELSGSGVTWKLCQYIDWLNMDSYSDNLVDLAACGIIGDMTSVGENSTENRSICNQGFLKENNLALKKINGSFDFNSQAVSFGIAPLVNAANRTNENEKAMKLFIDNDEKDVKKLVSDLKKCKYAQNIEVARLMETVNEQAKDQLNNKVMYFIVDPIYDVKGLLGNKLIEIYQRPVMVLEKNIKVDENTGEIIEAKYTGSARAIGVDNFKMLVDETGVAGTGGHENAFGVWFDMSDFDILKEKLENILKDIEFVSRASADIQITEDQITEDLIDQIKKLNKISGKDWPPIKVMISGIKNYNIGTMSGGKHLKLIADCGRLLYIKWNYRYDQFPGGEISVIGGLDSGFFGRDFYKQVILDDWKFD